MSHRGGSWQSSPPLLSPPLLIILLPILAFTVLFFTVPPLLSAATNLLQLSSSVKTSWNSLNILLVVLAILFGVFARRNDDESSSSSSPPQTPNNAVVPNQNDTFRRVSPSSETNGYESQQWYGFSSEETNRLQSPVVTGVTRMKRSSSSYPDLRQMETGDNGYKFRFFDDFEIEKQFRSPARATFSIPDRRKRWPEDRSQVEEQQEVRVKEIPVDTYEVRPSPPVKLSSPPPPPPPPPVSSRRYSNQMHRRVESNSEITELEDPEFTRIHTPPEDPTPPSPPRPSVKARSERRKSNVKREIAMVWASVLSNQRKRKKKQKPKNDHNHNHHYDNVEELTNNTTAPPLTPPPPPPPPPPSVFQSIFRKGLGKNKKIHSVPAPPPPPPSKRSSKPKNQIPPPPPSPTTALPRHRNHMKPPLPNKLNNFINENGGNQSPLIPVPPPLPPFKMPAMKFAVRGDFVKIRSNQSSRSASPEREHIDVEVAETITVMSGPAFCPSPDVNVKAATFIARLRGEWRLQKLNSIKEKGNASLPIARD